MAPTVTTSDLPTPADGSEAISLLIPRSPFVAELGLRLTDISDGLSLIHI